MKVELQKDIDRVTIQLHEGEPAYSLDIVTAHHLYDMLQEIFYRHIICESCESFVSDEQANMTEDGVYLCNGCWGELVLEDA